MHKSIISCPNLPLNHNQAQASIMKTYNLALCRQASNLVEFNLSTRKCFIKVFLKYGYIWNRYFKCRQVMARLRQQYFEAQRLRLESTMLNLHGLGNEMHIQRPFRRAWYTSFQKPAEEYISTYHLCWCIIGTWFYGACLHIRQIFLNKYR